MKRYRSCSWEKRADSLCFVTIHRIQSRTLWSCSTPSRASRVGQLRYHLAINANTNRDMAKLIGGPLMPGPRANNLHALYLTGLARMY